jgi:hypothetical protein
MKKGTTEKMKVIVEKGPQFEERKKEEGCTYDHRSGDKNGQRGGRIMSFQNYCLM